MADLALIGPSKSARITFGAEPAHNGLGSLWFINSDQWEPGSWPMQVAAQLSPAERAAHRQFTETAAALLTDHSWPSFPAWLDHLAAQKPEDLALSAMENLLCKTRTRLGIDHDLPTAAELLADRSAYMALVKRILAAEDCEEECEEAEQEYLRLADPQVRAGHVADMLGHLRLMWERFLAQEWERTWPTIQDSVAAMQSLSLSGMSTADAILKVVDRDVLPAEWEKWIPTVDEIRFIPSIHIGPYMMVVQMSQRVVRILTRAYSPAGATIHTPALSRSDLLVRLTALADDTRLRIIEMAVRQGELTTQDLIDQLGLSQSSASRHLTQLAANGYLVAEPQQRTKRYRLNLQRIANTARALVEFAQTEPGRAQGG